MKKSYCVLLAGGVGSRFWPMSRSSHPKQFLDIFGTGRTMLQQSYDRMVQIMPSDQIYVSIYHKYYSLVKEQLPQLSDNQIIIEPAHRNTAAAVALAAYKIRALDPEANLIVAPTDHLVLKEIEFKRVVEQALAYTDQNDVLLTLGITPNRIETGYGYIQMEDQEESLCKVRTFTEKPPYDLAKVFVESGEFLWNSGIFVWNVNAIITALETHQSAIATPLGKGSDVYNTPEEQPFLERYYGMCPSNSIDFGVLEKAEEVYVLRADFGWADVGTWASVYDNAPHDNKGNVSLRCHTIYYDSKDNVVTASDDKLVVLQGLDGYIVSDTPNALLICKRGEDQRIRQIVNDVKLNMDKKYT